MNLQNALAVRTKKGLQVADMEEWQLRLVLRKVSGGELRQAVVLVEQMKATRQLINLIDYAYNAFGIEPDYPDFASSKLHDLQARILHLECEVEERKKKVAKVEF